MLSHYLPFLLMFSKCIICWQDLAEVEEDLGPNLKSLSLHFIHTASKGLYQNNSDEPLFKALTSALLKELRPLAGCHKNTYYLASSKQCTNIN